MELRPRVGASETQSFANSPTHPASGRLLIRAGFGRPGFSLECIPASHLISHVTGEFDGSILGAKFLESIQATSGAGIPICAASFRVIKWVEETQCKGTRCSR